MCLAIPAQITELKDNNIVEVNILGATREASIDLTPTEKVGYYVIVHAGFAIEVVDPEFAEETLELVKQFPEMFAEEVP